MFRSLVEARLRSLETRIRNAEARIRARVLEVSPNARILLVGGAVVGVAIAGLYVGIWRGQSHDNRTRIALVTVGLAGEIERRKVWEDDQGAQLGEVRRTLYTQPEADAAAAAATRKPSVVESWQVNRDAELRGRIAALQRATLALEASVRELQRAVDELRRAPAPPAR